MIKYQIKFHDFLSKPELNLLQKNKQTLLKHRSSLFLERKKISEIKGDLGPINKKIRDCLFSLEEINTKLTKFEFFTRVLKGFKSLSAEKEFFYSYEADFRMRFYPQQSEFSPQASKLSRALIKFFEQFPFCLQEFQFYITRLYLKQYIFDEPTLLSLFNIKVKPILDLFLRAEKKQFFEF